VSDIFPSARHHCKTVVVAILSSRCVKPLPTAQESLSQSSYVYISLLHLSLFLSFSLSLFSSARHHCKTVVVAILSSRCVKPLPTAQESLSQSSCVYISLFHLSLSLFSSARHHCKTIVVATLSSRCVSPCLQHKSHCHNRALYISHSLPFSFSHSIAFPFY
jgi:hypothetical protein